jgi:cell division control protein 6
MGAFSSIESIFQNKDVLRDDYQPDELVGRDEERQELVRSLAPVMVGQQPSNVYLYGKTGVGKTLATRKVIDDLEEDTAEKDGIDVATVWVNCKGRTGYGTAVNTTNSLREPDNQIPCTGYGKGRVIDELFATIDSLDATHLIVVYDEVDELEPDEPLLYRLPRALTNNEVEDTKIGLIGTCNNFKWRDNLEPRIDATLGENVIHFSPYDPADLREILYQRTEKAFNKDTLTDDVVPFTAAKVGGNDGSARRAIDIVRTAGDIADRSDESTVTKDHAEQARQRVEEDIVKRELDSFNDHALLTLYTVAVLSTENDTEVRMKNIVPLYKKLCDRVKSRPRSKRTIQNHASEFAMMGILSRDEKNPGYRAGKYVLYDLTTDPHTVKEVIEDGDRFGDSF